MRGAREVQGPPQISHPGRREELASPNILNRRQKWRSSIIKSPSGACPKQRLLQGEKCVFPGRMKSRFLVPSLVTPWESSSALEMGSRGFPGTSVKASTLKSPVLTVILTLSIFPLRKIFGNLYPLIFLLRKVELASMVRLLRFLQLSCTWTNPTERVLWSSQILMKSYFMFSL